MYTYMCVYTCLCYLLHPQSITRARGSLFHFLPSGHRHVIWVGNRAVEFPPHMCFACSVAKGFTGVSGNYRAKLSIGR